MDIMYNHLGGVHSLMGLIMEATTYAAEHSNNVFVRPTRLPLYDANIPDNATTVMQVKLETAHKARVDNYTSFEAVERGVARFLKEVVDNLWINNLKDVYTFYTTQR